MAAIRCGSVLPPTSAQVDGQRGVGRPAATRKFAGEDWGRYNRISLWVYPDVIGAPTISCSLTLHNDGAHKLPDQYNEGRHESIDLRNHVWNHVVWEIAPLDRDRVTALEFAYSLPRNSPIPATRRFWTSINWSCSPWWPITWKVGTWRPERSP